MSVYERSRVIVLKLHFHNKQTVLCKDRFHSGEMEVCSHGIFMVTASLRGPLTLMNINEVPPGMVEGGTCHVSTECSEAQARSCWARWENVFLIHRCRNSKTFQGKIMNAFKTR